MGRGKTEERNGPVHDLVPVGLNLVYGGILKLRLFSVMPRIFFRMGNEGQEKIHTLSCNCTIGKGRYTAF
jgi:hypothetical protein